MSTFVEIRREVSSSKKTTACRLDDDFRITVREEETGKDPEHYQFNYSGLEEGEQLDGSDVSDPIAWVRVGKLGTDARCNIAVKVYHAADEADTVPEPGFYWYDTSRQYAFRGAADPTKPGGEAADPIFPDTAQTFPTTIFNISAAQELVDHPLPVGNTVAVSFTQQRLFAKLGSIEARRSHLKTNIRAYLDNRDFPLWIAGSLNEQATTTNSFLTVERIQSFVWWLEMLTMAISVDGNLNDERKFNLLQGESTLDAGDVISKISNFSQGPQTERLPSADRSAWTYRRMGSVAAAAPYAYTKPTEVTRGGNKEYAATTTDALVTLTGYDVNGSWTDYLRS